MPVREDESWLDGDGNAHWVDMRLGENKDYYIDWVARMANEGDTLAAVVWDVPTGLTKTKQTQANDKFTIWINADTVGHYEVKATITATELGVTNTYIRVMHIEVTET